MKRNKFIVFLCSLLFLCSLSIGIPNNFSSSVVKADVQNIQVDPNRKEHFNSISGRSNANPVWPVRSLGVVVKDNNPVLLKAVSEACDVWSPVFVFHDYGYVPLQTNWQLGVNKNVHYVVINKTSLPSTKTGKILGDTLTPAFSNSAFLNIPLINVNIDTNYIEKHHISMRAVIAHELGHVIGLHHSDDPNDFMSPYLPNNFKIDADDFRLVNRLYDGIPVVNLPNLLPLFRNNQYDPYQPTVSLNNSKRGNNFSFQTQKGYTLLDQIEHDFILINETHFKSLANEYVGKASLRLGRRNYSKAWKNIPNGTFTVNLYLMFKNFEPRTSNQDRKYCLILPNTDDYENPIPDRQIMGRFPWETLHAHHKLLTYLVRFKVKVKNHHYSYIASRKYHNKLYANVINAQ